MKSIIIVSGGMDSYTLLHDVFHICKDIQALTFSYGQRHFRELECAEEACDRLGIKHTLIGLPHLRGSALTYDGDVPDGHYTDVVMKQTVVSHRNLVMLSVAASYAAAEGATQIFYGAHAGDHAIYPDCREEFITSLNRTLALSDYSDRTVSVVAPYLDMTKTEILSKGLSRGLDYSKTWTCYKGRDKACGKCGSCVERLEAFAANNVKDPLEYEDV